MAKRKQKLTLSHWFIPHAQNDHRPHLIRVRGLALVALLIFGVQASAFATRPPAAKAAHTGNVLAYATNITPTDLLIQTNQVRAQNGLPALHMDARLNASAGMKAADMFAEDYWAHVSPSGIEPWYWFGKAGYTYSYAGENLAKDFDTTSGVMAGWMNSPGHRANILNSHYVDVGFAVQNGTLVGGQTTLVVAHYASPGATYAAPAPAPPATPRPRPAVKASAAPQPTPAVSATPAPPSPSPSATASPRPVAPSGQISPGAPAPKSYSLFAPLALTRTLNLASLITMLLLLLLLGVYAATHMVVWRKGLHRWESRHYRLLAGFQIAGLTSAILLLAASGFGSVG